MLTGPSPKFHGTRDILGSHPTSVWTEDTLTHVTLHVIATHSATTGTNWLAVTVWEVHLATPLGNRLLCHAAGTDTTVTSSVISE